jgi:putative phage-type endonuclease
MPLIEIEQGSAEWLKMRAGCCTASRVADAITKLKNGNYTAARDKYIKEVAVSRITGLTQPNYVSQAMEHGIENEPLARAAYEMKADVYVEDGGMAIHDRIKWFSASPDGRIGDDGLLECKCPNTGTHIDYLLAGVVPAEYMPQMMAEMACTGRRWVDFVSFDPRMPKKHQLFVRRFHRDDERITAMEAEVQQFLAEVDELLARLSADDPSDLTPKLVASLHQVSG